MYSIYLVHFLSVTALIFIECRHAAYKTKAAGAYLVISFRQLQAKPKAHTKNAFCGAVQAEDTGRSILSHTLPVQMLRQSLSEY